MATRSLSSINSVYCLAMSGENAAKTNRALLLLLCGQQLFDDVNVDVQVVYTCVNTCYVRTHTFTYLFTHTHVHIFVYTCVGQFCFGQNHSKKRAWNWPTNETLREQRAQCGNVWERESERAATASGRMTTMSLLPAAAHKNPLLKYFSQKVRLKIMHIHTYT